MGSKPLADHAVHPRMPREASRSLPERVGWLLPMGRMSGYLKPGTMPANISLEFPTTCRNQKADTKMRELTRPPWHIPETGQRLVSYKVPMGRLLEKWWGGPSKEDTVKPPFT